MYSLWLQATHTHRVAGFFLISSVSTEHTVTSSRFVWIIYWHFLHLVFVVLTVKCEENVAGNYILALNARARENKKKNHQNIPEWKVCEQISERAKFVVLFCNCQHPLSSRKRSCINPMPTTIRDLNDHVLRETFSHLDDLDLHAVSDVCSQFERNALAEISSRFKQKRFVIWIYHELPKTGGSNNMIRLRNFLPLIRKFGPFINSFKIHVRGFMFEQMMQ